MPPVLQCCLAVVAGLLVAPHTGGSPLAWALLAVGAAGLSVARGGALRAAGLTTGLALGLSLPDGPVLSGSVWLQGVRVGAPAGRSGDVALVRATDTLGTWAPATGRVRLRFDDRAPPAGTPIVAFGLAHPPNPGLPGAPDPVRAAALSRIHTVVVVHRWVALGGSSDRPSLHDPSGVLRAVALGDRSEVPHQTLATLRRTGTAHLLAISGFHVGVIAMLAASGVRWLLRATAAVWAPGIGSRGALAVGVLAAVAYALIAGAPISALRAASLLGLVAVGRMAGRSAEPLSLLGIVLVALAAGDPSALATPGLQLSFGAVAGLLLLGPVLQRRRPEGRVRRWLYDGLSATTAATLGTLPAAAWWFQAIAPWSGPANLLAMPIMALGIVPCAAGALLLPAPLSGWAGQVGTVVVEVLLAVLRPLEVDPFTPAVGAGGAAAMAVLLPMALRWPGASTVLVAAVLGLRPVPRQPTLTVLDVGQGDALLVERPDGTRALVDAGPRRHEVVQWLRRRGVRRLDQLVLTHGERDHGGGVPAVLESLRVDAVWAPDPEALPDARRVGPAPPTALHPWPGDPGGDANTRSAVLHDGPFLLTGDIDAAAEARILHRLDRRVELLKVPHHGSDTSSTDALLDATRPALAVVSAGRGNRYGHPHESVLQRYAERGIPVLRTDRHGTLVVTRTERGLQARGSAGDVLTVEIDDPVAPAGGLLAAPGPRPPARDGGAEPPQRPGVGAAAVRTVWPIPGGAGGPR